MHGDSSKSMPPDADSTIAGKRMPADKFLGAWVGNCASFSHEQHWRNNGNHQSSAHDFVHQWSAPGVVLTTAAMVTAAMTTVITAVAAHSAGTAAVMLVAMATWATAEVRQTVRPGSHAD